MVLICLQTRLQGWVENLTWGQAGFLMRRVRIGDGGVDNEVFSRKGVGKEKL